MDEVSAGDPHNSMSRLLECSICLNFIVEPVTISCGHTFCKMCLVKSLRRHKKKCPTCRSVCHVSPEDAPTNSMIKSLALSVDAELYARRLLEHEAEKQTWDTVTPIFYYNGNPYRPPMIVDIPNLTRALQIRCSPMAVCLCICLSRDIKS